MTTDELIFAEVMHIQWLNDVAEKLGKNVERTANSFCALDISDNNKVTLWRKNMSYLCAIV
jgi:hypothetical protein